MRRLRAVNLVRSTRSRWLAVTLPLVVAAACVAPPCAQASQCGAQVTKHPDDGSMERLGFRYVHPSMAVETTFSRDSLPESAPRMPCHGPTCSQSPPPRDLAPTAEPVLFDQWLIPSPVPVGAREAVRAHIFSAAPLVFARRAIEGPLRPPRSA